MVTAVRAGTPRVLTQGTFRDHLQSRGRARGHHPYDVLGRGYEPRRRRRGRRRTARRLCGRRHRRLRPGARPYYYGPAPVYVAPPPPAFVAPACYWTRGEPVWNGYAWVRPRVQVCE